MNYRQAKIFCICIVVIVLLLCVNAIVRCSTQNNNPTPEEPVTVTAENNDDKQDKPINVDLPVGEYPLTISPKVQSLAKQFADLNDAHLAFATRIGISPISAAADIMKVGKPIREVMTCEHYYVERLSHSHPFLVEPAANLLDTIGARFNAKLMAQNGGNYKIKVTSLLRTRESVNRLQRGNVNSTDNSAHLYGTTFDISYAKFFESPGNVRKHSDGDLKNLLAEVLMELRDAGKCLVKYERKQGCFHITATGK